MLTFCESGQRRRSTVVPESRAHRAMAGSIEALATQGTYCIDEMLGAVHVGFPGRPGSPHVSRIATETSRAEYVLDAKVESSFWSGVWI